MPLTTDRREGEDVAPELDETLGAAAEEAEGVIDGGVGAAAVDGVGTGGQQLLSGVALVVGDGLAATADCCAVEAAVLRR